MGIPLFLQKTILKLPYFGRKMRLLNDCGYTPGHYYSPIPDLDDISKRRKEIFKKTGIDLKGIDLRKEAQFALLEQFSKYYKELPYDFETAEVRVATAEVRATTNLKGKTRYQVNGPWYKYSDAIMLYSMMQHFKPKHIVEVGSGYSSAIMLDTNELFFDPKASFTFIDPYPERLLSLLKEEDKKQHKIIRSIIQHVDLDIFKNLESNDILFIDSSHVSKVGSDLNYILFEILPILKPGVLIHFHDIFYPFELPEHWVLERKWFWNENYILRAYLTDNRQYDIINFNTYLHVEYRKWFSDNMPACLIDEEGTGSIWIRKN